MGQVCPCGSGGGEVPGMDESEAVPLTNGEASGEASVSEAPKETKAPTANGAADGDEEEVKKKKVRLSVRACRPTL
jgi:hypothetical protein